MAFLDLFSLRAKYWLNPVPLASPGQVGAETQSWAGSFQRRPLAPFHGWWERLSKAEPSIVSCVAYHPHRERPSEYAQKS